ncbi:MAG: hypothetical protein V1823_00455 [Chloroflexota bacterium]
MQSLRRRVARSLAKFPGRTREIEGRAYLHFEDYCRWRGRKVKGNLRSEVQQGFVIASWNAWVDTHGGEGVAALADAPAERLCCYVENCQYQTCPDSEGRLCRRQQMLDDLRTLGSSRDPEAECARDWKDAAEEFLTELYSFQEAVASISQRYFDREEMLFPDPARSLTYVVESTEKLVGIFNDSFTGERNQLGRLNLQTLRQGCGRTNLLSGGHGKGRGPEPNGRAASGGRTGGATHVIGTDAGVGDTIGGHIREVAISFAAV